MHRLVDSFDHSRLTTWLTAFDYLNDHFLTTGLTALTTLPTAFDHLADRFLTTLLTAF